MAAGVIGVGDDELVTGEAVALSVRPAGFLLRALAGMIDLLAELLLLLALVLLTGWLGGGLDGAAQRAVVIASLVLCLVVVPVVVETASGGRSLGRLAAGVRIVRDDGGAAGLRHAFVRALAGTVEVFASFGGLAVLVALLNPKAKRVGDFLAGTYAQNERMPRLPSPELTLPPALAAWATVADVAALPDPLARRISAFLAQSRRLTGYARETLGTELAREAAAYVHPLPPVDAVTFLAGVSVVRREREARALAAESRRLVALTPTLTRRPRGFPER